VIPQLPPGLPEHLQQHLPQHLPTLTPVLVRAIELLGTAVFAASGVLSGARRGMDLLGVAVIAVVTALGGGTLRDVLLDRHPIAWIAHTSYLWTSFGATALTLLYVQHRRPPLRALLIADALGLAFFVISGVQIAEQVGERGLIAVLMGAITGTAGGVIRDVLSAEVPLVLRPGTLYVTAALLGASVYLGLESLGAARAVSSVGGMLVIAGVRLWAIRRNVRLPVARVAPPA
jgi:uncharacterized membrane protein YeiH